MTVVIGFLARGAWYNTYYVYLLIVPILILTAIMLPKGKKDVKILGKGVGSEGAKRVFSPSMIYLCIFYFFLGAFSFAFYTNVGMSIISKGLGDSSVVGLTTAWNSVLTIVIGIGFGVVLRMFKKFTLMSSLIITAVAYLIMVVGQNLWAITLGCILYGVGQGIQMPASVFYITEAVDSESSTMAIGISMAMTALGITLSPVVVNAFAAISGPLDGTTGLMVAGVAYGVLSAVELIRESVFNKYSKIGWAEKPKVTAE